MKNGFTLVELSIAIVIIGLLIGGILIGESLIKSAKINAFIRQIQQIDIATSNFKLKFKSLPGDTNKLSPIGDNDGIIEDAVNLLNAVRFTGESANFWSHLSLSGFDPNQRYTSTITGTFNSSKMNLNGPIAKTGEQASIVIGIPVGGRPNTYLIANYQQLGPTDNFYAGVAAGSNPAGAEANAIKVTELLAIDSKIDDGSILYSAGKKAYGYYYDSTTQHNCTIADDKCYYFITVLNQVGQD
jgi:prepilin-type N-terminal cleavage/methylation domain-containing protein